MVYPFLGHSRRLYPLLRDTATGVMLTADPGGAYGMEPVNGAGPVSVPPDDGLWGPAQPPARPKTMKKAAPAAEGD